MRCGELGFKTAVGKPCQQNVPAGARGCIWHSPDRTAAQKHFTALKGGLGARRRRLLSATYPKPRFRSEEEALQFVEDLTHRVLTQDVDPRRIDTALRGVAEARGWHGLRIQREIAEMLSKLEHGEAAFLLLQRLQVSLSAGRRHPLPGVRQLAPSPAAGEDGA